MTQITARSAGLSNNGGGGSGGVGLLRGWRPDILHILLLACLLFGIILFYLPDDDDDNYNYTTASIFNSMIEIKNNAMSSSNQLKNTFIGQQQQNNHHLFKDHNDDDDDLDGITTAQAIKPNKSSSKVRTVHRDQSMPKKHHDNNVGTEISSEPEPPLTSDSELKVIQQELSKKDSATLILALKRHGKNSDEISTGTHTAEVVIHKSCEFPRFVIRLTGKTLVIMNFQQDISNSKSKSSRQQQQQKWSGTFDIPLEGKYSVEARWYGCTKESKSWTSLDAPITLEAVGSRYVSPNRPDHDKESYLFSDSVWMSSQHLKIEGVQKLPDYLWMDPDADTSKDGDFLKLENKKTNTVTTVAKSATFKEPNGMYRFNENGNYELVCFWGSPTMHTIREKFMSERGFVAPGQRPFKFHYYNVTNLVHPDKHWPESDKTRCRKCKHIFLSIDELDEPLSREEFQKQYIHFVRHLLNLMDDSTFPIWVMTNNEPPMNAKNCFSPTLPRSSDHPCNDVIKSMFQPGKEQFPKRVHLMDNSALVLPQFDQNRDEILANVAMRVFVAVGKGVSEWRDMGQQGKVDGLHRNGKVEPNFELVPYNWETPLSR